MDNNSGLRDTNDMGVSNSLQSGPKENPSDWSTLFSKRTDWRIRWPYIASRYTGLVSHMYVPHMVTEGVVNKAFTQQRQLVHCLLRHI